MQDKINTLTLRLTPELLSRIRQAASKMNITGSPVAVWCRLAFEEKLALNPHDVISTARDGTRTMSEKERQDAESMRRYHETNARAAAEAAEKAKR